MPTTACAPHACQLMHLALRHGVLLFGPAAQHLMSDGCSTHGNIKAACGKTVRGIATCWGGYQRQSLCVANAGFRRVATTMVPSLVGILWANNSVRSCDQPLRHLLLCYATWSCVHVAREGTWRMYEFRCRHITYCCEESIRGPRQFTRIVSSQRFMRQSQQAVHDSLPSSVVPSLSRGTSHSVSTSATPSANARAEAQEVETTAQQ